MIVFIFFILLFYIFLIIYLILGVSRTAVYQIKSYTETQTFTIVVPFRNEASNLPDLLQSFTELRYDIFHYEILLIDDESDDNSVVLIEEFHQKNPQIPIRVLTNERYSQSPKKDAIRTGISQSKYDWIFTTDADCVLPKKCLQVYSDYIQNNNVVFVAGPVAFKEESSFVNQFQRLDWLSLTGVTIGSFGWQKPLLCSGANLVYNKKTFQEIQGFQGNDHISSGDDVFLLAKMNKKFPKGLAFLNHPEVIVETKGEKTWQNLWEQHIRWAGKTGQIPNPLLKAIGVLVIMMNLLVISLFFMGLIDISFIRPLFIFILIKISLDAVLLYKTAKIISQKIPFISYLWGSIIYPFFSVGIVLFSVFSGYSWKGRRIK